LTGPRLPFHRHLKWLCLEELPDDDIKKFYDNIQFAIPQQKHLADCQDFKSELMVSTGTLRRLRKKIYSDDDHKMWEKRGFGEIYLHRFGKADWSELGKVLNHPVMRVALECCIIAKVPDNELAQLLPSVYSLPLSEASIATFKQYFFDIELMERRDWQDYLYLISEDRYSYVRILAALTKPRDEVLHLVGLPTKAQFGTRLKNIMDVAAYRFEYFARQGSHEAQAEARNWAKILIAAGEKHEKYGATDMTDFGKVLQTEFEYSDAVLDSVTPEMLAGAKPQLPEGQGDPE
jgi:hypothetical protein